MGQIKSYVAAAVVVVSALNFGLATQHCGFESGGFFNSC